MKTYVLMVYITMCMRGMFRWYTNGNNVERVSVRRYHVIAHAHAHVRLYTRLHMHMPMHEHVAMRVCMRM